MIPDSVTEDVQAALREDVGQGDLTAQLVPENQSSHAQVICRETAILCGRTWFDEVFKQLDDSVTVEWFFNDGSQLSPGDIVCALSGNSRSILTGERTALNFLQTLSATATIARQYATAVAGTHAKILDTRKTLPGLRAAQKYAVTCGGCSNHRIGLFDAILIKENHIVAAGSIAAAVQKAHSLAAAGTMVEIEVETPGELAEALDSGAKRVLLDNFSIPDLATAVQMNRRRALLEASGGITLENVKTVAKTGVDYISVGELTKNIKAVDFSMLISEQQDL